MAGGMERPSPGKTKNTIVCVSTTREPARTAECVSYFPGFGGQALQ